MAVLKSREGMESVTRELAQLSPEITAAIARMRQVAYRTGQVPGKYKLLTAAAISVAIRCEPCIRAYVEWAARMGGTRQELAEFLNVAMTMQGCPGEEWALKALSAFDDLASGTTGRGGGGPGEGSPDEPAGEVDTCCRSALSTAPESTGEPA